jgi:hypothetical protein
MLLVPPQPLLLLLLLSYKTPLVDADTAAHVDMPAPAAQGRPSMLVWSGNWQQIAASFLLSKINSRYALIW